MKRLISIILSLSIICGLFAVRAQGISSEQIQKDIVIQVEQKICCNATLEEEFEDDSVIVMFKQDASRVDKSFTAGDFKQIGCKTIKDLVQLSEEEKEYAEIIWGTSHALKNKTEQQIERSKIQAQDQLEEKMLINLDEFRRVVCIELENKGKENVLETIKVLEKYDDVLYAGPNYITHTTVVPNDPLYSRERWENDQWGIKQIQIEAAWDITTGTNNVTVGIIDSGIDANHPDLAGRVSTTLGANYVGDGINHRTDPNGHGTHVAGIIGAIGNNPTPTGIAGINWNVNLVSLRVFDANGSGNTGRFTNAINYARTNNIPIINISGGGYGHDPALEAAVNNYNGLMVFAAGNGWAPDDIAPKTPQNINLTGTGVRPFYPASYNNARIIAVAASDRSDNLAGFSNLGNTAVHIAAPGVDILSTVPGNNYESWDGTSMAAPVVAGLAALIMSLPRPGLPAFTIAEVRNFILNNADAVVTPAGQIAGNRRLNAARAVAAAAGLSVHTITYDANGGYWDPPSHLAIHDISTDLSSEELYCYGYNFLGWSKSSTAKSAQYLPGGKITVTANTTLYAVWKGIPCKVTLDRQSAPYGSTSVTATYGSPMPTTIMPVKTGHTFHGYFDTLETGGTQYYNADGTSAHIWDYTYDTTLYARWTAITSSITLDPCGGWGGTASISPVYGQPMPPIMRPARMGYTFMGYMDFNGKLYYFPDGSSARNWDKIPVFGQYAFLFALWSDGATYTVTLNYTNGGTGGAASVNAQYGYNMPYAVMPTRNNFDFAGYFDTMAATGGWQYYDADGFSARPWNKNYNATLYARWKYTVTYDANANGASVSPLPESHSVIQNQLFDVSSKIPKRNGFVFLGWSTDPSATSAQFWPNDETGFYYGHTTLYAVWKTTVVFTTENTNGILSQAEVAIQLDAAGVNGAFNAEFDSTVTSIGYAAFYGYSGLAGVTIPNTVTIIEEYAFFFCVGLNDVTISSSVTNIGDFAFGHCYVLRNVYFQRLTAPTVGTGAFDSVAFGAIAHVKTGSVGYTTPTWHGMTVMFPTVFTTANANGILSHVDVTAQLTAAGISRTTGMFTAEFDSTVKSIGNSAFAHCAGLISVTIPNMVTSIENVAFYGCVGLSGVVIPNSVIDIGDSAFAYCAGLTGVTIPNSAISIGNAAFYGCTELAGVTIPNSVANIGDYAFSYCTLLADVTISNGVSSIGNYAFYGCMWLTDIVIPNSVNCIGIAAFHGCMGLTDITIPNSVTSIGNHAFYGCTELTSVTIPDSITSIGDSVFAHCTGLTSVVMPDSVISIGVNAFFGCTGLTDIVIPNSVTSIGDYAFARCTGLTDIVMPDSVTSIGDYSFYGCTGLTCITIPDGITSIGYAAFYDCTGLTNITIPNSVTSIGDYAFYGCTGLTGIAIPDSVASIGYATFAHCTELISVIISDSVTSVGAYAFAYCPNLSNVFFYELIAPDVGEFAFYGSFPGAVAHVYAGSTGYTMPTWHGLIVIENL